MRLPLTDPADQASIDFPVLNEMVDFFLEKGGTYFDTGYPYHNGMSEVAFREAVVKRHPRDSFTITDKMPLMYSMPTLSGQMAVPLTVSAVGSANAAVRNT